MKQLLYPNKFLIYPNKFLTLICNAFLCSMALLPSATSANALPGQKLTTIRQWSSESLLLPPNLVYNPEYAAYTGMRTIEGGLLALYVKIRPQDNISVWEQVVTQVNAPNLSFARNDREGLTLIERIYSAEIAEDFRTSKYVARIGETKFYQGSQFAYTVLEQSGIRRFSVIPVSNLKQAIQREVACQTDSCVVYQPFVPVRGNQ